jgi:xanthine dehydrogenase accessory factor
MREVIASIDSWLADNEAVALATVVQTWGSAPRREGAKMALTPAGHIAGSVSGGCVEGAVYEAGTETLATGRGQLLSFGVADETAWDVGLACGGKIRVFVEPLDIDHYQKVRQLVQDDRPGARATIISGPVENVGRTLFLAGGEIAGHTLPENLVNPVYTATKAALARSRPEQIRLESMEIFIDVLLPAPTLILVGGVHIAIALAQMARTVGFRTIVVDPRRAFGSDARFPDADRLIQAWPDKAFAELQLNQSTAVVMLTHDPKIDDPALKTVLPSPAFYIGALGSTRTHAQRRERLLAAGVPAEQVDRIHAPIGLDIGAQTPEEIAVAVLAEIVAVRRAA